MKKNFLNFFLILPLLALLVITSCETGIKKSAIKDLLYDEENCLQACDQKEAAAIEEFQRCARDCGAIPEACFHVPPANRTECIRKAIESCQGPCFTQLQEKLAEVNKCRKACRDKFSLELKIK